MGRRQPASYDAVILDRRRAVSALRLRGKTFHEILVALPELRKINPETGKPWSYQTIHADWKTVEKEWLKSAQDSVEKQRAKTNAELEEIKRAGWAKEDLTSILKATEQQRRLFGLDRQQDAFVDVSINLNENKPLTPEQQKEELEKRGLSGLALEE